MKIVFLDIDGVLNNPGCYAIASGSRTPADPGCVAALNFLIEQTFARIVVSSSWRIGRSHPRAEMAELLNYWGVKGLVVDVTPRLHTDQRGEEIQAWLDRVNGTWNEPESFVILDDDSDMAHLKHRLIQTAGHVGLTMADAERAIAMLQDVRAKEGTGDRK